MSRLSDCFAQCKSEQRTALTTFTMACDPDYDAALELLLALPKHGADIVELGMPFSDPMADGPAIQAAGQRALKAGGSVKRTFDMARSFRAEHPSTPLILMGYLNPLKAYGLEAFCRDADGIGVDGLILVDLPLEEYGLLTPHLKDMQLVPLIAPTSDGARLEAMCKQARDLIYLITVAGITGAKQADSDILSQQYANIRRYTDCNVMAGFGIKTAEQAASLAPHADGLVVGSAIVDCFLQHGLAPTSALVNALSQSCKRLS